MAKKLNNVNIIKQALFYAKMEINHNFFYFFFIFIFILAFYFYFGVNVCIKRFLRSSPI